MRVDEFDYDLPEELIAQHPLKERDRSRLLVVDRRDGTLTHKQFFQVVDYLSSGDMLVVNNTKVYPARLKGRRRTGGKTEVLLLKDLGNDRWECLARPGHKVRVGDVVFIGGIDPRHSDDLSKGMIGHVVARTPYGGRIIEWEYQGSFQENLEKFGEVPLPPYIKSPLDDPSRYQTIYAKVPGSAAAPTAGLHFTSRLLEEIEAKGVKVLAITLDVGLGTFRPVREEEVEAHKMHEETFSVSQEVADQINEGKSSGKSLFAVGTTVVRALESAAGPDGLVRPYSGPTDLFIYPGYKFKVIDHLITNFHLPRSTLLMLVSAFAGKELIMKAYQEAIKERYRFFSFGDAMLII